MTSSVAVCYTRCMKRKCSTNCQCGIHSKGGPKLKAETARTMREHESAYVGAMLDAEGWVTQHGSNRVRRKGRLGAYLSSGWPGMSIGNQSLEIISALLRATGCGTVHMKEVQPGGIIWTWGIHRARDSYSVAKQVEAYSQKAQKVLVWFEEKGGLPSVAL